tara:strand:- start:229 stop:582 length:354 start_codon:yes stop_codon:yes gene_type:complete
MTTSVNAHEMVPTYPILESSYMQGLQKTKVTIFNKRPDVEYYEIGVFTKDWEPIPFVSTYKVFPVPYLSTVTVELFIRNVDRNIVTYICSKSKLRKSYVTRTAVSSRICSRVKRLGE